MFETVDLPDCPALVTWDCRGLAVNVTENERRQSGTSNNTRHLCADKLHNTWKPKILHFSLNKWFNQSKSEAVMWTFWTDRIQSIRMKLRIRIHIFYVLIYTVHEIFHLKVLNFFFDYRHNSWGKPWKVSKVLLKSYYLQLQFGLFPLALLVIWIQSDLE